MSKFIFSLLFLGSLALISVLSLFPAWSYAADPCPTGTNAICTFQTLPFTTGAANLSTEGYINALYRIAISIAAILVVIKIILAGVKYLFSDVITNKEAAKKDIRSALLGLIIILGAVTILQTINPQIINMDVLSRLNDPNYSKDVSAWMSDHSEPPAYTPPVACAAGKEWKQCGSGSPVCADPKDTSWCTTGAKNIDPVSGDLTGTETAALTDEAFGGRANTVAAVDVLEKKCLDRNGVPSRTNRVGGILFTCAKPEPEAPLTYVGVTSCPAGQEVRETRIEGNRTVNRFCAPTAEALNTEKKSGALITEGRRSEVSAIWSDFATFSQYCEMGNGTAVEDERLKSDILETWWVCRVK